MHVIWRRDLHEQQSEQSSLLRSDLLITAERRSRLARLEVSTGAVVWDARVGATHGWLDVAGDHCLYLSQQSHLQCIDLDSGVPRWDRTLEGIHGHLMAMDGVVLVGGWRGYTDLRALDVVTGRALWTRPAFGRGVRRPVATRAGIAISDVGGSVLDVLRPQDGACLLRVELPMGLPEPDATPTFTATTDAIYVFSSRRALFELRLESDCRVRQVFEHPHEIKTLRPTICGSQVFFVDSEQLLWAYDLSGNALWSAPINHNCADQLPIGASRDGETVYVGTSFGVIAAYDREGCRLFAKRVAKRISTGVVVTDSRIVFGASGALIALSTCSSGQSDASSRE